MLEKALSDTILFQHPNIELKDLQLTSNNCHKSFTDHDNPRDLFNGLEELRERLVAYYDDHGVDYSRNDTVNWDKIGQRIIERLPAAYLPTILNLKITAEHNKRVWSSAGIKMVDKEGKEHESIDEFSLLKVTYNQLKLTMFSIYDSLSTTWANAPANRHKTKLPAFNQVTIQYAQCIEDC